jgi:hypothetical protein
MTVGKGYVPRTRLNGTVVNRALSDEIKIAYKCLVITSALGF